MIYSSSFSAGIKPDPILSVSECADLYRVLPRTSSHEHGKYRTSRTPYLKEPMDCLSIHSPVRRVVVRKPTQIGATEFANNWLFYIAIVSPGPCMMVLPTVELAKRHVKGKVQPSLREMPIIMDSIREVRGNREEMMIKEFPGGFWQFIGSSSAAALRSVSVQFLIKDDLDGWEAEIGEEGDPSDIIDKRTDAFGNSAKILEISTPTDKELSHIDRSFLETDQSYYYVPCPHCKKEQKLVWGGEGQDEGIVFNKKDLANTPVQYRCTHCRELIPEYHKTWMLENGLWVPTHPERKLDRGFHLNSLYSPIGWVSWKKIVREFLKAKRFPAKLKVWVNTRLGEAWEAKGERPDWTALKSRAKPYSLITEEGAHTLEKVLFLTAGVDVQRNRLALLITGWGRGEQCWILYWGEIYGDPEKAQLWFELDFLLDRAYSHFSGVSMNIICTAIDSGDLTQIVYNYVRSKGSRRIATKGMSIAGKPVLGRPTDQDVNHMGKIIQNGVKLWPIGSDTAKDILYPRLTISDPGPGMIHFPIGLGDDFYLQLTAEKKITRYVKGYPKQEWFLPSGRRNEVLDCLVLSYVAAVKTGLNRMPWERLEQSLQVTAPVSNNDSNNPVPQKNKKRLPMRKKIVSPVIANLTLRNR